MYWDIRRSSMFEVDGRHCMKQRSLDLSLCSSEIRINIYRELMKVDTDEGPVMP
jgi:hypothetical protein